MWGIEHRASGIECRVASPTSARRPTAHTGLSADTGDDRPARDRAPALVGLGSSAETVLAGLGHEVLEARSASGWTCGRRRCASSGTPPRTDPGTAVAEPHGQPAETSASKRRLLDRSSWHRAVDDHDELLASGPSSAPCVRHRPDRASGAVVLFGPSLRRVFPARASIDLEPPSVETHGARRGSVRRSRLRRHVVGRARRRWAWGAARDQPAQDACGSLGPVVRPRSDGARPAREGE